MFFACITRNEPNARIQMAGWAFSSAKALAPMSLAAVRRSESFSAVLLSLRSERTFTPFTCIHLNSYTGHKFGLTEMWKWDRHGDAHTHSQNITFMKIKRNDPLSTLLYWASQKNRKNRMERKQVEKDEQTKKWFENVKWKGKNWMRRQRWRKSQETAKANVEFQFFRFQMWMCVRSRAQESAFGRGIHTYWLQRITCWFFFLVSLLYFRF